MARDARTANPQHRLAELNAQEYVLPGEFLAGCQSPALLVYMDQVRHNVSRLLELLGGDAERWRPHLKTTKLPEVWRELVQAGVRNFKCATTRELAVLLEMVRQDGLAGIDVLVAYAHNGPNRERIAQLAIEHPDSRVSMLVEDLESLAALPSHLGVFIDINPGMNRSGIHLDPDRPEQGQAAMIAIAIAAGSRFRGLHWYEGHLHDGPIDTRRMATHRSMDMLCALVAESTAHNRTPPEVITSGTPTFAQALEHHGLAQLRGVIHRVSPGTVVFHDLAGAIQNPDMGLMPAAILLSRVVSHPQPGVVTLDAGSKSLAAEAGDPVAHVIGHPDLRPLRPSEEHLPLSCGGGPAPLRGTPLYLVPRHICPTVNLADAVHLIEKGRAPRVALVSARGHE